MEKYKINIIYNNHNINDILVKVLKKELQDYFQMTCQNQKRDLLQQNRKEKI